MQRQHVCQLLLHSFSECKHERITKINLNWPQLSLQVQIYYGSGTGGCCCTCRAYTACALTRWQHLSAWNNFMAAIKLKIRLCRSMHTHLKNIPVKVHPDLIWNDEALGFFEEIIPTRRITTRYVIGSWSRNKSGTLLYDWEGTIT